MARRGGKRGWQREAATCGQQGKGRQKGVADADLKQKKGGKDGRQALAEKRWQGRAASFGIKERQGRAARIQRVARRGRKIYLIQTVGLHH